MAWIQIWIDIASLIDQMSPEARHVSFAMIQTINRAEEFCRVQQRVPEWDGTHVSQLRTAMNTIASHVIRNSFCPRGRMRVHHDNNAG